MLASGAVAVLVRTPCLPAAVVVGVIVVGLRLDAAAARRAEAEARLELEQMRIIRDRQLALAMKAGEAKRDAEGCRCGAAVAARWAHGAG